MTIRNKHLSVASGRHLATRAAYGLQSLAVLAHAYADPNLRPLIADVRHLLVDMPSRYDTLSLPAFLAELTPASPDLSEIAIDDLRRLVDAMARLYRRHTFGLCLRRSLLRYHFLRRAGLPSRWCWAPAYGRTLPVAMASPAMPGPHWMASPGRNAHKITLASQLC